MPLLLLGVLIVLGFVASMASHVANAIGVPWADAFDGLVTSSPIAIVWVVFMIWAVRAQWQILALGSACAIMLVWKVWAPIIVSAHTSEFVQNARARGVDIPPSSIYDTWEFACSGYLIAVAIAGWSLWSLYREQRY